MQKGINIREHMVKYGNYFSTKDKPCIFLSHKSEDKDYVESIGNYIKEAGLNIYLDKYDEDLQKATNSGDYVAVTNCIHKGVDNSTHVLCIVSDRTVKSWWVPYELGYANKSGKGIATLKRMGNEKIPEYLSIGAVLDNIDLLNKYLADILQRTYILLNESEMYKKASYEPHLSKASASHPLSKYLKIR